MFTEIVKNIAGKICYHLYFRYQRKKLETTRDGVPLKPGISASIIVKDDVYNIPLCLNSLVEFADQFICIDNGSIDGTLEKLHEFKKQYGDKLIIEVVEMPGSSMAECRDQGLQLSKYQWHVRWDSDCVAHTSGPNNIKYLREVVLSNNRARAIQLPRIDIIGDLRHTSKLNGPLNDGERCLIRLNKNLKYDYYQGIKWETIKIPFYYSMPSVKKRYYFHCDGSKSDENLIHRFHYFHWRGLINDCESEFEKEKLRDFEKFQEKRNMELFHTTNSKSLKFRYQRQLVYHFTKYEPEKFGKHPELLWNKIKDGGERFIVEYKDGKPYCRKDNYDQEMKNYIPTEEDNKWDPEFFLKLFLSKEDLLKMGINPI